MNSAFKSAISFLVAGLFSDDVSKAFRPSASILPAAAFPIPAALIVSVFVFDGVEVVLIFSFLS